METLPARAPMSTTILSAKLPAVRLPQFVQRVQRWSSQLHRVRCQRGMKVPLPRATSAPSGSVMRASARMRDFDAEVTVPVEVMRGMFAPATTGRVM